MLSIKYCNILSRLIPNTLCRDQCSPLKDKGKIGFVSAYPNAKFVFIGKLLMSCSS